MLCGGQLSCVIPNGTKPWLEISLFQGYDDDLEDER